MKINIINYEEGINSGILSKFAYKLFEELEKIKGIEVTVSNVPDITADINHHINYLPYRYNSDYKGIDTLMITHIWEGYKLDALKEHMTSADLGICMSNDTKNQLIKWGFDKNKLATVLPAHDGEPRRYQIVSILTNVYPDGCKRENMFTELVKTLDLNKWAFRIMGSGWENILTPLVAQGLQVDYFAEFNKDNHKRILESSDYNLYFGEDEGSMGLLDAKNAGLKLIAPNVGFNIDVGVDYPFHTQEELNEIFKKLSVNPVEDWTWKKYAKEHIKLWKKLLK
jgi:hypothetical protein